MKIIRCRVGSIGPETPWLYVTGTGDFADNLKAAHLFPDDEAGRFLTTCKAVGRGWGWEVEAIDHDAG